MHSEARFGSIVAFGDLPYLSLDPRLIIAVGHSHIDPQYDQVWDDVDRPSALNTPYVDRYVFPFAVQLVEVANQQCCMCDRIAPSLKIPTGVRCLSFDLAIDPEPADRSSSRDAYGNVSSYFQVTERHRALTVVSESVVDVAPPVPQVYREGAALTAWETARPSGHRGVLATEFAMDTHPAEITAAVIDYAAPSFIPGRPLIEVLRDLNARIFNDFTFRTGSTTVSTRVDQVLRARAGVCQDFARLAIACLRANGLAVSYVSGYLATDPPPGKQRLFGVDATHAWAAVWTPQNQWLGLDPTNDQFVDERYITVGWGRDYADIPPLRGIIYTDSEHSVIDVSVDVVALDVP
jgi:transglutaminase-like putative cysteine protease